MRITVFLGLLSIALAAEQPAPLGKLIDLGGYRFHLYCTGRGKQTVLLSPGGGDFSFDWYLVPQQVSAFARVCSYDRPDNAWSDPGPQPRTLHQEVYELHLALEAAKEHGPYILVGHSLGGLAMRIFAERYPDVTAGMVLADATSPDSTLGYNGKLIHMRELAKSPIPEVQTMKSAPPALLSNEEWEKARAARNPAIHPPFDRLPEDIQRLQLWAQSLPPRAQQGGDYLPEEMNELYRHSLAPHTLGDRPLITILGLRTDPPPKDFPKDQWDALNQEKRAQKRSYRDLSTNSKIVEDARAGHSIYLDDPSTVVAAIREVSDAAARRRRLE